MLYSIQKRASSVQRCEWLEFQRLDQHHRQDKIAQLIMGYEELITCMLIAMGGIFVSHHPPMHQIVFVELFALHDRADAQVMLGNKHSSLEYHDKKA